MRGEWRFHTAGEIIFGRGVVRRTGEAVRRQGAERALLITDNSLVAAGLHDPVEQSLAEAGVSVDLYAGSVAKPTLEGVTSCLAAAQDGDYGALVVLGGGSNIDLAKAVAVLMR